MKKLKKPTIGVLMATLVFSNMQLGSIYGYETGGVGENVNTHIVQNNDIHIKNIKANDKKEIINIPDINLKKAINSKLGKDENSDITRAELESIDELWLFGKNINSLEGIQYCINLRSLRLHDNKISDINVLSGLNNLSDLGLSNNKISDISALSGLNNLSNLDLSNNKISDINVLSGLNNLSDLGLHDNGISDISALSGLNNLSNLDLSNNKISDISALSELNNLSVLILYYNEISDISALSELNNLSQFHAGNNKISDISALSRMNKLDFLTLENNKISDIGPLSELNNLTILHMDNNKISDINALSKLNNIYELSLTNNKINDINVFLSINDLQLLNLSNNQISDIKGLSKLNGECLWALRLDNNQITDITPLLNIGGQWTEFLLDLNKNFLDLNDPKTMEVLNYLEGVGYNEVYYDNQLTQIPPVQNPTKFNDIKDHWAKKQIDSFISSGYINGYSDGTFKPNNSITRAEFVTIVNNYFGLTKGSGKVFSDTNNHWAKSAIDIAVTNGVCNGISSTEFKPNDPITREQASVMISNYKKLSDSNLDKLKNYKDASNVSSWAKPSVEGMIEKGYMGGYSDNTFKPKSKITRAEAVVTLSRITK